jgi:hypothetical protein
VFGSTDIANGWDGKDAPDGVYIAYIIYTLKGGHPQTMTIPINLLR